MSAKAFKDCILERIEGISNREKAMEAVADGIYEYLTNVDNQIIACSVNGMLTIPAAPVPLISAFSGPVNVSLTYLPAEKIKQRLLASFPIGVSTFEVPLLGIFTAIAEEVAAVVTTITGWESSSLGVLSGVGVTSFPVMALDKSVGGIDVNAQGVLASIAMLAARPKNKEDAWALIEKFVLIGLSGGIFVAPPTATGTVLPTGVFSLGVGTGIISYK